MSTTREQYLQKRLQSLELQVQILCDIVERLESMANAFAFDLGRGPVAAAVEKPPTDANGSPCD